MKKIIDFFKNTKFRIKLIMIYVCIGLLPLFIFVIFSYQWTKKILFNQEKNNIKDYLYQNVNSMDNQIKIYNNLSDYISFNQEISKAVSYEAGSYYELYSQLSEIVDPLLDSLKYLHNEVDKMTIYSRNNLVKHGETLASVLEIEKEWWFEQVQKDNLIHWYISRKDKMVFSVRSMPVLNKNAKMGILYISIDYPTLFERFQNMHGSDYGVFITDEKEDILYSYNEFKQDKFKLNYKKLLKEKKNQEKYTIIEMKSEENPWTIFLYKPNKKIYQSIYPVFVTGIFVVFFCITFSTLSIWILSKFMVTGIEKLRENMANVEAGKLEIQVVSTNHDEIGDLIRGFGKMISKIKVLIEEVYEGKIKQKDYEMKALQAQINPHFLYNTLSLINWMALEADREDISNVTLALSSFYRTALNKGNNIISLEKEIENVKSYINIQLVMHDYEFDVEIDVEEELKQYMILNLILQPIVENSIDHGIDLKTNGRGKLRIEGKHKADEIYLIVSDNGVGMEEELIQTILTKQSKGYGIRNVNERITLYYGEQYQMEIESIIGIGTKTIVRIPIKQEN